MVLNVPSTRNPERRIRWGRGVKTSLPVPLCYARRTREDLGLVRSRGAHSGDIGTARLQQQGKRHLGDKRRGLHCCLQPPPPHWRRHGGGGRRRSKTRRAAGSGPAVMFLIYALEGTISAGGDALKDVFLR